MAIATKTQVVTDPAPMPEQTFLVGESVYLRAIEKDDAKYSVALRGTTPPYSPQRTEAWITEDTAADVPWNAAKTLAIRRRADDVIVGTVRVERGHHFPRWEVTPYVDPLHGPRGLAWKAEAADVMVTWLSEERQAVMVLTRLPASEQVVIDRLLASGMRRTARLRERYWLDGRRVDQVILQRFNAEWQQTLGDPAAEEPARVGLGTPRPRTEHPMQPNVPKGAMMVGKRVYLRPYAEREIHTYTDLARFEPLDPFLHGRWLPLVTEELHYHHEDERQAVPGFVPFAAFAVEDDTYIGEVALIRPDFINRTAETASWFKSSHRGQGFGSEAKHLLLDYAFNTLGLHMVESWVRFDNARSAAALRKQGYRDAGRVDWGTTGSPFFTGFVIFDLLAEEWRALPVAHNL